MARLTKDRLIADRLEHDEVEVPGMGGTVEVRALSRFEALQLNDRKTTADKERAIITLGLVDPPMTESEVGAWMKACPAGELEAVSKRIGELSGLADDSAQEAAKSVDDGSES